MKKLVKRGKYFFVLISILLCLSGCGGILLSTEEVIEKDITTISLESSYEDGQTQVIDEIKIKGEPFSLVCKYDTGDQMLNDWRVTSNKIINMTAHTKNLPEGYSVYIEHVHADIVLRATEPQLDGITQDSMDDSDHRVPSKGFFISDTIEYNNVFSIEGYTDQFYTLWGYACGDFGSVSSSYKRLTELNIREAGCYAEMLAVVYDIVIITPECEEGYVKSVYSKVLIPLTSELSTVTTDLFTGEVTKGVYTTPDGNE